jgi:hypothetical protein
LQGENDEDADYAKEKGEAMFMLMLRTSVKKRIPMETMTMMMTKR